MKISLELNETKYHILVEPSCYTPIKHGLTEKGTPKELALGYPNTLSRAVNMIIREEMATKNETVTLQEYVERYEKALEELREYVDF